MVLEFMLSHFRGRCVCVCVCDVHRPFFLSYCSFLETIPEQVFLFSTVISPCPCLSNSSSHLCISRIYLSVCFILVFLIWFTYCGTSWTAATPSSDYTATQDQGQRHTCLKWEKVLWFPSLFSNMTLRCGPSHLLGYSSAIFVITLALKVPCL